MVEYSIFDSVMEPKNHFKNGASSKSQMSRINFRIFYLVVAVVMLSFTACTKNEQTNDNYVIIEENPTSDNYLVIKAYNVQAYNEKSSINVIAFAKGVMAYQSSDNEWHYLYISAKYENGSFELNFPATIVPDEYLFSESKISEDIILSDIQAKTYLLGSIDAFNSEEAAIGSFWFYSGKWSIEFIYVDRDFTAKGITDYGVEYDCSYKKGWNILYSTWLGGTNYKRTTQKPLNENFKCYYLEYGYY